MGEKIYHIITYDPYTNEIITILNFHNLENALARGKEIIKTDYKEENMNLSEDTYSLEELYNLWEEEHGIEGYMELAESEFED